MWVGVKATEGLLNVPYLGLYLLVGSLTISLPLAGFVHLCIEKPIINWGKTSHSHTWGSRQ
jgi:peptidoglycan/LPS O-acetylase OafA/YrhL